MCEVAGCRRPAAPGWRTCSSDGRWLGDALARLGDRYAALSPAKSLQAPSGGSVHGGLASERDPARLRVIALSDWRSGAHDELPADPVGWDDTPSVFGILARWADEVRTVREIQPPKREIVIRYRHQRAAGPVCQQMRNALADQSLPCRHASCRALVVIHKVWADLTVATERKLLADQLPWLLGTDWAADFHADITSLWTLLGGGRTVGACPDCGAGLHAHAGGARCSGCRRAWTGLEMTQLTTGRTA